MSTGSVSRQVTAHEFLVLYNRQAHWTRAESIRVGSDNEVASFLFGAAIVALIGSVVVARRLGIGDPVSIELLVLVGIITLLAVRIRGRWIAVEDDFVEVNWALSQRRYDFSEVQSIKWRRSGSKYGRSAIGGVMILFNDGRYFDLQLTLAAASTASLIRERSRKAGVVTEEWLSRSET
jgi:hypothetical protein